jgi:isocitrate/isopropylmalate dehydrogenase
MILAGAMMLDFRGETTDAASMRHAVAVVINEGKHLTRNTRPGLTVITTEMADAIVAAM